jgi:nitrate reductase NapAB chaperone NapD
MITVGVLVRALHSELGVIEQRLGALPSVVQTLELEEPGSLGLVLQAEDLDAVHAALTREVGGVEGVLAAWPLHAELEGLGASSAIPLNPDPNTI